VDDYVGRFNRLARPLGFGPLLEQEVEDRKGGGMAAEADLIVRVLPPSCLLVVLDERGHQHGSPEFAARLAGWRDEGRADLAFVIGGADGLAPGLRDKAHHAISFGWMVWPHMLVRVMLAEQIYRAATILSGSPYHRA
jgi:23S rRNA (pseudouridine1915-N3)-methyltransferase